MNVLAVAMLAAALAIVAIMVSVASVAAAMRWRRIAHGRDAMRERAVAIAYDTPARPTVFDFASPIRRSTALEILGAEDEAA